MIQKSCCLLKCINDIVQVAPLVPKAVLSIATGGGAVTLYSTSSVCYNGPCVTTFVVVCGSKTITRSGVSTTTLTPGNGGGYDVDLTGVTGKKCAIALTVANANGANNTATTTLRVSMRLLALWCSWLVKRICVLGRKSSRGSTG